MVVSFEISGNVFTDNWSGIDPWENADRFSGSPANTAPAPRTLVNPGGHRAGALHRGPDCSPSRTSTTAGGRRRTCTVVDNTFTMTASHVPGCTLATGCGINWVVFSNYGT